MASAHILSIPPFGTKSKVNRFAMLSAHYAWLKMRTPTSGVSSQILTSKWFNRVRVDYFAQSVLHICNFKSSLAINMRIKGRIMYWQSERKMSTNCSSTSSMFATIMYRAFFVGHSVVVLIPFRITRQHMSGVRDVVFLFFFAVSPHAIHTINIKISTIG